MKYKYALMKATEPKRENKRSLFPGLDLSERAVDEQVKKVQFAKHQSGSPKLL